MEICRLSGSEMWDTFVARCSNIKTRNHTDSKLHRIPWDEQVSDKESRNVCT